MGPTTMSASAGVALLWCKWWRSTLMCKCRCGCGWFDSREAYPGSAGAMCCTLAAGAPLLPKLESKTVARRLPKAARHCPSSYWDACGSSSYQQLSRCCHSETHSSSEAARALSCRRRSHLAAGGEYDSQPQMTLSPGGGKSSADQADPSPELTPSLTRGPIRTTTRRYLEACTLPTQPCTF